MKKRIILLTIAGTFLIGIPSWGESVNDLKTKLTQKKVVIDKKKKELSVVKKEKKLISSEIEALDRQIDSANNSIYKLRQQINSLDYSIEEKEAQIKQAEVKMKKLDEMLKARVTALYKNGDVTYLDMILDSNGISDFFSRYYFVKTVLEHDKKLFEETAHTKAIIEEAKKELEANKAARERARNYSLLAKRNLDNFRGARNGYLQRLSSKQKDIEEAIDAELRESERLTEKIKKMQTGSKKVYTGGAFLSPLGGSIKITSEFGLRMHPILHKKKMHTGVDIKAKRGQDIFAVSSGTVIMADLFGGYGKTVIIDHGSGKSSLYAHASKLCVKEGKEVKAGEKIAEVGSTGLSTGPHLHFEVRENGTPVNPLNYISE